MIPVTPPAAFPHLPPEAACGKVRRLARLCDADGRFAMLAIDQRTSLRRALRALPPAALPAGGAPLDTHLVAIKRVVTESLAREATAVLADPELGYAATAAAIPPTVGVLLAAEVSGYEAGLRGERRSRLLPGWTAAGVLQRGADAVKMLVWHHPGATAATQAHQQALVEQAGQAAATAGVPFLLEVVTYGLDGVDRHSAAFAPHRTDLVVDAVTTYSDPRFHVDLFKIEFPVPLRYVETYQGADFATGEVLFTEAEAEAACRRVAAAAAVPWVILSAGVAPAEFEANIRMATAHGASGFLCGRAVWKPLVPWVADEARMRAFAESEARATFQRLRAANACAQPWHQHPRYRGPVS
ncbi:MAG: tagatose 1,6-diphosphate aldolase [Bacteroidota bacterium]